MNLKKNILSKLAIALVIIACFVIDLDLKLWENYERVIEFDVRTYYGYLPATFIFNDIRLEHPEKFKKGNNYYIWANSAPNGKSILKMTYGLALLYAPFFFVGHAIAVNFGYESIGFSEPYKMMLLLSTIFYLALGLFYLRKVLKMFFTETVTAVTILLLGLGTNLLCYASESAPMPHVYNFALFALFIYYTIQWYQKQTIKRTILIGLLIGLIALIRPSNAVIVLFFIFYGVTNFREFTGRFVFLLKKKIVWIPLIAFCAFLVWVPQFLYWKEVTGQFFFYSYGKEPFFFSDPKFYEGLIGFRKGWLIYTPMMAFAILGFILLRKEYKKFRLAIILFTILNLYIIFSWWCWWYGGTFGQRSIIESYALLSIPLACFVKFVFERKWFIKIAFALVWLFFIWLNIFQTYQFEFKSLHYDGMTKELYFKQFGKFKKIWDFDRYVKSPDWEKAMEGER